MEVDINIKQSRVLTLNILNPTDDKISSDIFIRLDGIRVNTLRYKLSPYENQTDQINISKYLKVVQINHTVTVSTYGDYAQFNFTREFDSADPGPIPTPTITDVEITNGTIDGQPSAVAKVTVSNPGVQRYGTKLMVHTEGTDGSLYPAVVPPGENKTITVELLDERGAKVAGEARLYTGNISERDGSIDQVEFVGQAEKNTTVWNADYQPVSGPWRENHYTYQNDSIETGADESDSDGFDQTQKIYLGVGVVLLAFVAVRRFR